MASKFAQASAEFLSEPARMLPLYMLALAVSSIPLYARYSVQRGQK
jgi:hypothetical protein